MIGTHVKIDLTHQVKGLYKGVSVTLGDKAPKVRLDVSVGSQMESNLAAMSCWVQVEMNALQARDLIAKLKAVVGE